MMMIVMKFKSIASASIYMLCKVERELRGFKQFCV